jgi:glycosyltransferase involved in cell wall biosynthesis
LEAQIVVSVIIPLFNRRGTISRVLSSLLAQTYRPLEIIVIDDGSSDGGGEVVREWGERHASDGVKVELFVTANHGASAARNLGMCKARGEYIQFLDSDDVLSGRKLEVQVNALRESGAAVAVCDFEIMDESTGAREVKRNDGDLLWRLALGWSVSASTPLIKRNLIQERVRWLETLRIRQDMDFMFKVLLLSEAHVYTPGVMFCYIKHGGPQISDGYGTKAPQHLEEIQSIFAFWIAMGRRIPIQRVVYVVFRFGEIGLRWVRFGIRKSLRTLR